MAEKEELTTAEVTAEEPVVEEAKVEEKQEPAKDNQKAVTDKNDNKKQDAKQNAKKVDNKKKKERKPSRFGKRTKETISELKKVTWPTFGAVVKKTGVVLAVVLIFAVVLFGIDRLLAWIFSLLVNTVA